MSNLDITILMPCLNEETSLPHSIKKAKKFIDKNKLKGEVLISDNGSTDNSISIAKKHGCRVIHTKTKGYGAALKNGMNKAKSKIVIFGDADGSYDFSQIGLFYKKLTSGYAFVIGDRFAGKINNNAMPILHKYLGNPVLSFLGRFFFKNKINDFHCGLRGINKDTYKNYNKRLFCNGMEFATEMVAYASIKKFKTFQAPVTLHEDKRINTKPHLRTWPDGWRHLKFIIALSPIRSMFLPGLFFILLNFTFMIMIISTNFSLTFFNTKLSFLSSIYFTLFSWIGIFLIISSLQSFRIISQKYNEKKTDNFIFNSFLKIKSDTFFLISLTLLFLFLIFFYPMIDYWYLKKFIYFDMSLFKFNLIITTFIIPYMIGSLIIGVLNYLNELFIK
tara:strand:- start:2326 stop:3495 length:1170 start_codon:yes stop_codon:yes gene_type:complete